MSTFEERIAKAVTDIMEMYDDDVEVKVEPEASWN